MENATKRHNVFRYLVQVRTNVMMKSFVVSTPSVPKTPRASSYQARVTTSVMRMQIACH